MHINKHITSFHILYFITITISYNSIYPSIHLFIYPSINLFIYLFMYVSMYVFMSVLSLPGQYFVHREKINELVDFPITGFDLR